MSPWQPKEMFSPPVLCVLFCFVVWLVCREHTAGLLSLNECPIAHTLPVSLLHSYVGEAKKCGWCRRSIRSPFSRAQGLFCLPCCGGAWLPLNRKAKQHHNCWSLTVFLHRAILKRNKYSITDLFSVETLCLSSYSELPFCVVSRLFFG